MGQENTFTPINQDVAELEYLSTLKYNDLCSFLLKKYGFVSGDYFVTENCKTPNSKIKRTNEGLFIHHIFENKVIQLSYTEIATKFPFEYQKAENLVYCNIIEHMLLHICIVKEYMTLSYAEKTGMAVGIGGLYNFIVPQIIDYFNGYEYKQEYMKIAFSVLEGKEEFIMSQIKRLLDIISSESGKIRIALSLFGVHYRVKILEGKMTGDDFKNKYFDTCRQR